MRAHPLTAVQYRMQASGWASNSHTPRNHKPPVTLGITGGIAHGVREQNSLLCIRGISPHHTPSRLATSVTVAFVNCWPSLFSRP
jgi:hypothetical protein